MGFLVYSNYYSHEYHSTYKAGMCTCIITWHHITIVFNHEKHFYSDTKQVNYQVIFG